MQFGKFHGWAFYRAGALLILVQLAFVFSPQQQVGTAETPAVTHRTTAIPGIMGGLSLVFGIGLYVTNRNKRQE